MGLDVSVYAFFGVMCTASPKKGDAIETVYTKAISPNCRMTKAKPSYKEVEATMKASGCSICHVGDCESAKLYIVVSESLIKLDAHRRIKGYSETIPVSNQTEEWTQLIQTFCKAVGMSEPITPEWKLGFYLSY